MKQITLIFILGILMLKGYSQYCKLTGTLLDETTGNPMPYVNVILTSPVDSTFLLGSITDENGKFLIENILSDTYNLKLSFIGYEPVIKDNLVFKKGTNNIGYIRLKVLTKNLDDVTVKAVKTAISYKVDRKVIDAESFPGADVAMDLLENVPSVQVDLEGNLTYRGDGTFKVFINGHPVANGIEKLKQLPVNKIDKIEVITNPSANYDAEGTAGIIQVILKKSRLQGYAITSSVKSSTIGTFEWLYSVNKNGERGGWYFEGQMARYSWNKMEYSQNQTLNGENVNYQISSSFNKINQAIMNYVEFGCNYDLSGKDFLDFSIYTNPLKCTNDNDLSGITNEKELKGENITYGNNYNLNSNNYLYYRYLGTTLTYEHAFKRDRSHLLTTYFDFSTYLHPLEEKNKDVKSFKNKTERLGSVGKEYNEIMLVANISYKNELTAKTNFEIGANTNLDHIPKVTSTSGSFDENDNLIPFTNIPGKQEVNFIQDVYAAFATFKSEWGKFEYQLGLRTEWTKRKSNYSFIDENGLTSLLPAKNDFWDFFPSFHSVYNFSETHQLALNYSKRINRPQYYELIPLYQYSSPYAYYKGNSELMPSYSNAFELSYKKSWKNNFVGVELFTRNSKNIMQAFLRIDSSGFVIQTPENVGDSWSTGLELMTGIDLKEWWNINFSTSMFTYKLLIEIDDIASTQSQFRSDSRINNTFVLPRDFSIKWDLNYQSPIITAQSNQEGFFYSNLAIKKTFKEKRWDLTLAIYNIFNSIKYSSYETGENFEIVNDYFIKPTVSIKVSYNFNNQD